MELATVELEMDHEQQKGLTKMSKSLKKWEVFPGSNTFYCDGRLISGQKKFPWEFYIMVFLIIVTLIMFFMFDGPYLANHVSPILPVISAILSTFLVSNLLKASFIDPGIIPRSTKAEADLFESEFEQHNRSFHKIKEFTRKIEVKGQTVLLSYCSTCKIIRPPKASHCSSCDNCVEVWDHHCFWIINCVGRRNYRYFYRFVILITIDTVFVFLCSIFHLYLLSKEYSFLNAISRSPVSVLVCVITFISSVISLDLAFFHMRLLGKKGYHINCADVLCTPNPPSLIDVRGKVISPDCESPSSNSGIT